MTHHAIARTGRVQTWMDDPSSRLPVSCTVFVVEDSMEGPNGIEASWRFDLFATFFALFKTNRDAQYGHLLDFWLYLANRYCPQP